MKVHTRVSWMTAALTAALLAANATAADPNDKTAKDAPAKVDKDVEAWVNVLAAKIADRHDSIRESARHALIAVGKPALPALQKLANGDDGAAAEAAHHVIARIEGGPDGHPGPFGPHGFRGEMGPRRGGFPMGSPPSHPGAGGSPGAGPHPGGPPGRPGGFDPNMIFNLLSGGKDYIVVSEMLANPIVSARDPGAKERAESFMKRHGITNGQLTREQFAQYMQERVTERRAAHEAANPGGPGRPDGFGPPAGGGARGPGGPPPHRPAPDGAAPPPGPGAPPAHPDGPPRGVTSPRDEANPFGGGFTRPDQRRRGPDGAEPMPPARPGAGGPGSPPDGPGAAEPNGPGQRRPRRDGAAGAGGPPAVGGGAGGVGPRGGFGGGIAGPGFPGMLAGRAFQDLNLTAEQTAKVKEALEAQVKKSREANEKAREDFMQTLKGVLDEEQIKKLESNLSTPPGSDGRPDNPRPPEE